MKKTVILYGLILYLLITNLNFPANRITKKYIYKDFNKVEVSNGMLLNVTQSSDFNIEVNAEESDFEYLKVEKKENTLRIYIDKENYRKSGDIKIDIQLPSLTGLDLSGGSQGKVAMDIADNFDCELSGGAGIAGSLSCNNINMEISGGSTVSLSGKGTNLTVEGSGGSIFHLKNYNVKNVDVDLSGGSRLEINMNGILNGDASGGSRVIYYGDAKIGNTDFSGGAGISRGN
jgi:hypothetical protein